MGDFPPNPNDLPKLICDDSCTISQVFVRDRRPRRPPFFYAPLDAPFFHRHAFNTSHNASRHDDSVCRPNAIVGPTRILVHLRRHLLGIGAFRMCVSRTRNFPCDKSNDHRQLSHPRLLPSHSSSTRSSFMLSFHRLRQSDRMLT
jgi:hypothetical protein